METAGTLMSRMTTEAAPNPTVYLETLGCSKNEVDSAKVTAMLGSAGYVTVDDAMTADVVMVNTCAFVESARQESIDTIIDLADTKRRDARLVVIGCMAQRYETELRSALPEADAVVGLDRYPELVGTLDRLVAWHPLTIRPAVTPKMDILSLVARPTPTTPYGYVKVAEGCDKPCTFCAIPAIRGKQRSRRPVEIREELVGLVESGVSEVVLVAQDLAAYGRDIGAPGGLPDLLTFLSDVPRLERLRLLYLHPREIGERLLEAMTSGSRVVPYFDLSLQHVSGDLLRRMKRPGNAEKHSRLVERIRELDPDSALRSSFIVGFPGESDDHVDELADFLAELQLDWAGFFPYSAEPGTAAADMEGQVPRELAMERLRHLASIQEEVTQWRNSEWLGRGDRILVDQVEDGVPIGRSHRQAPEIDGVVRLDRGAVGEWVQVEYTSVLGPDMEAMVSSGG
jgi:ribosomal protein S12 methylthiotransferase RimO